jgi:hypothetical protein
LEVRIWRSDKGGAKGEAPHVRSLGRVALPSFGVWDVFQIHYPNLRILARTVDRCPKLPEQPDKLVKKKIDFRKFGGGCPHPPLPMPMADEYYNIIMSFTTHYFRHTPVTARG